MKFICSYLFVVIIFVAGCSVPDPVKHDNRLTVYPNPSSQFATIHVNNPKLQAFTVKAFDSNGKKVVEMSSSDDTKEYDLTLSAKGNYYVILSIGGEEVKQNLLSL